MEDQNFKSVDIIEYLNTNLQSGNLEEFTANKITPIMARKGTVGEEIVTYTENGLVESRRTVTIDSNTGNSDWVATKVDSNYNIVIDQFGHKNEWIIPYSNFINSYHETEIHDIFRPVSHEQKFVQVKESITFTRTDGKTYSVSEGGYLNITNLDKIRVISKRDFDDTYEITNLNKKKR